MYCIYFINSSINYCVFAYKAKRRCALWELKTRIILKLCMLASQELPRVASTVWSGDG